MDWLIDSTAADPARALDLLDAHLRRHATDPAAVSGALSELERTLAGALEAAAGRPVRAHLDWTRNVPSLRLVALRGDADGLELDAAVPAAQRTEVRALDVEPLASTPVPVARTSREVFVAGPPPTIGVGLDVEKGMAAVPVAMAAVHEAHPTLDPEQVASAAGALLADVALQGTEGPLDPRAAAGEDRRGAPRLRQRRPRRDRHRGGPRDRGRPLSLRRPGRGRRVRCATSPPAWPARSPPACTAAPRWCSTSRSPPATPSATCR